MDTPFEIHFNIRQKIYIGTCLTLKLLFIVLFSSGYNDILFRPFVSDWLSHFHNPWDIALQSGQLDAFPYNPLMLYAISAFYAPAYYLGFGQTALGSIFFSLPTLLADCSLFFLLRRLFPLRCLETIGYYFLSPIILYSCYMHGQLDLIPTAFIVWSTILLTERKFVLAAFLCGLAFATKAHTLIALPFMFLYMVHCRVRYRELAYIVLIPFAIYLFFCLPFIFTESFQSIVLLGEKQFSVLDLKLPIGKANIYLVFFVLIIIIFRFAMYKKVNKDLLFTYLALLYTVFILLIAPAPGWYVWTTPYLSIFFIKYGRQTKRMMFIYIALSVSYLVYFIFFYHAEYKNLIFLNVPLNIPVESVFGHNLAFTILEALLLTVIYSCYKLGVRSNAVYRSPHSPVIGIGGDSGAGKSTLLNDFKQLLMIDKHVAIREIETDGYHRWERGDENWQHLTHLDPKANHLHNQAEQIMELKAGRKIMRREYRHTDGQFSEPKLMTPGDFILVCGLHPFYLPKMRKAIDLKVFMDTQDKLRRHWKIVRDTTKRSYNQQSILDQLEARMEDSQKYISPQRQFSDLIVHYFTEDEFEPGDSLKPTIKLRLTLGANLQIEGIVSMLRKLGNHLDWDYADDLWSQHIVAHHPIPAHHLTRAVKEHISNPDHFVGYSPQWADGYRGLVQIMALLVLSETLKDTNAQVEI